MSNYLRAENFVVDTKDYVISNRKLSNETLVEQKQNSETTTSQKSSSQTPTDPSSIMTVFTGTLALIISAVGLTIATEAPTLIKALFAVVVASISTQGPILPITNAENIFQKGQPTYKEQNILCQNSQNSEENSFDTLSGLSIVNIEDL